MRNQSIPVCFFPSTVLFLDDSRDFLLNFVLQLDENLAYSIFDSPYEAIKLIQAKQCELEQLSKRCLTEYIDAENCPMTNNTVNVNLAAIHAEVYNAQRFAEISVVVVDYDMPGMNGLEFCERMEDSATKKILLTGQADEEIAIQAFNDGLIDRYIKKSAPDVADRITKSINQLQKDYFSDMSALITPMLSVSSPSCLKDRRFKAFFNELIKKNNIIEFYLMDNSGSFLLLDQDASISCLVMKNETDLRLHYDLAKDNGVSEEMLADLEAGYKIPVFNLVNDALPKWNDWAACLLPANKLICDEVYYYTYIKDPTLFDIRQEKIRTYDSYLNELDAKEMLLA